MDLSIRNNVSNKNNNVNFKGVRSTYDKTNERVRRFVSPILSTKENPVYLEITLLDRDEKQRKYVFPKDNTKTFGSDDSLKFKSDETPLDVSQDDLGEAFAYRFYTKKNGKKEYFLDPFEKIQDKDKQNWNLIIQGPNASVTPDYATMYHIYPDSEGPAEKIGKHIIPTDSNFVRSHFNQLGGTLKSITHILLHTNELDSYDNIIATPKDGVGADPVSSHGYWPFNLYQSGNEDDFKELVWELFKRGKNYVVDGAFTSQSIQSPMFQHVLKWGEQSPFYNWFKVTDKPTVGVLPDENSIKYPKDNDKNPYNHIGIRLVNSPNSNNYLKNKPTYIQFYDDRLEDLSKVSTNELFKSYNISNPKNHYDITTHQDSVQPFYFELDPNDSNFKATLAQFEGKSAKLYNDFDDISKVLEFDNFTIGTKEQAGGATYWDGNVDIAKLNLSNPKRGTEQGCKEARNYLYGVSELWTEKFQSDLVLKTAQSTPSEKRQIATSRGVNYDEIVKYKDYVDTEILKQNKTTRDYVRAFPMQSIETSPELSAIFAQAQFKDEFLNENNINLIGATIDEIINSSIPKSQKQDPDDLETYKVYARKVLANTLTKEILASAINPDVINSKTGEINKKALSDVTLKSLLSYDPSTPLEERQQVVSKINVELRKQLNSQSTNLKQALVNQATKQLENITLDDFIIADSIVLQGHGGIGWRFDAAKDISDLDEVRNGNVSFDDLQKGPFGNEEFFTTFIGIAHKYNPGAYKIGEITDWWSFYNLNDKEKASIEKSFEPQVQELIAQGKTRKQALKQLKPQIEEKTKELEKIKQARFNPTGINPHEAERDFLAQSEATTGSNYSFFFNPPPNFIGVDPENGKDIKDKAGNVEEIRKSVNDYIETNQPRTVMLSHSFANNHDKPTIAHTLPINMQLFMADDKATTNNRQTNTLEDAPDNFKQIATKVTGRKDYKNISSKAVAVGDALSDAIRQLNEDSYFNGDIDDETALELTEAIKELANGRDSGKTQDDFDRAEKFGFEDYRVTIKDVIDRANEARIREGKTPYSKEDKQNYFYEIYQRLMYEPAILLETMWEVQNAMPGTPTSYNGAEFLQAGYETPNKNVFVANRGPIWHEMLENFQNSKFNQKYPLFKYHYDKYNAISGLYKMPEMSAIRSGYPISLDLYRENYDKVPYEYPSDCKDEGNFDYQTEKIVDNKASWDDIVKFFKEENEEDCTPQEMEARFGIYHDDANFNTFRHNYKKNPTVLKKAIEAQEKNLVKKREAFAMYPIYKYNEQGSKVFQIITNFNAPRNELAGQFWPEESSKGIASIPIKGQPLADGTVLKRKIYKENAGKDENNISHGGYVDSKEFYIIKDNKIVPAKKEGNKFVADETKKIIVDDTVLNFYVPSKSARYAQIAADFNPYLR